MAKKKKKEIGCLNIPFNGVHCVVKEWNYQICLAHRRHFPPLYSYSNHFYFEGVTKCVSDMTEINVLCKVEKMSECDFDEKNPPHRCGTLRFINKDVNKNECEPYFSGNLFVDEDTYKILYQAFSTRFASNQVVHLNFNIGHQRQNEPGFWEKAWQEEELDISECRVHLGGEVREDESPVRESNRNTKRFVLLIAFILGLYATLLAQAHIPGWEIAILILILLLLVAFIER